jgi:ADP-glucose pyrophosphorylase
MVAKTKQQDSIEPVEEQPVAEAVVTEQPVVAEAVVTEQSVVAEAVVIEPPVVAEAVVTEQPVVAEAVVTEQPVVTEQSVVAEAEAIASVYVVMDNLRHDGKIYAAGDVFDAEITDVQLFALLFNGVLAKRS